MTVGKLLVCAALCVAVAAWFCGCSGSVGGASDAGGGDGSEGQVLGMSSGGAGPGTPNGQGICAPTCPKPCNVDNDCETEIGELCCDYGSGAKVCEAASACPVFCANDSVCQTSTGQACVQTSLAPGAQSTCADAGSGIEPCKSDADCDGATEKCCTIYSQPICTQATQCPASCTEDSQCNTTNGEICCSTVQALEPNLNVNGLCVNPVIQPCPKACTASSDCAGTGSTLLCCNGLCAATCAQTCTDDSECVGQICCKSPTLSVPAPPVLFSVTPQCSGTPVQATCAGFYSEFGACRALGCSMEADAGSCYGSSYVTSCAECGTEYDCNPDYCPTCSSVTSAGSCTGTPYYDSCDECQSYDCQPSSGSEYCVGCTATGAGCTGTIPSCAIVGDDYNSESACLAAGCSWAASSDAGGSSCTGTPSSCASIAEEGTCEDTYFCTWSTGSCTGTITPCANNTTDLACEDEYGCTWTVSSCVGKVAGCSSFTTDLACSTQYGCEWASGGADACIGTPTACAQLPSFAPDGGASPCESQTGCSIPITSFSSSGGTILTGLPPFPTSPAPATSAGLAQ